MSFLNKYPYTDFHELNLDWILEKMHELGVEMDEFKALNTITFSGVWDITKQYAAWTVVNDNNLGYISIKPVPAGVLISNTDYWASIVDYSAELAGIHNDITTLQGNVGTLNTAVANLQKEVADGKWVFFGDSYQNYSHWYDRTKGVLQLGSRAFYAGASGHGFTVTGGAWVDDFTAFCSGRTDLAEFKHVVVGGGLNDASPDATDNDCAVLNSAIDTFCAAVRSAMPNAKIYLGYFGSACADSPVLYDRTTARRILALGAYMTRGTYNSCQILNNVQYSMYSHTFFDSDQLHPISLAGELIGNNMAEAIMSGSAHVTGFIERGGPLNFDSGEFMCYTGVRSLIDNGTSRLVLGMVVCTNITNAMSIGSTEVDFGEIPYRTFMRNTDIRPMTMTVSDGSSSAQYHVNVRLLNRHLMVSSAEYVNKNTVKTITANANSRIDFDTITFDMNTLETM